jgi:inner membrane protein
MHAVAGYAIYHVAKTRTLALGSQRLGPLPATLVAALGLSLLPDLDFVVGFAAGDPSAYHNNVSHSLFFGLVVALLGAGVATQIGRGDPRFWFALILSCYWLHVALDYLTVSRGVMAFWPLTAERYAFPWPAFLGLHWSEGWQSPRHLLTLAQEIAYGALALLAVRAVSAVTSRGSK